MSDVTIYMNVKHNLGETFEDSGSGGLGGQIVLGDTVDGGAGDTVGYNVNGNDVQGFPYTFRFTAIKLDVSVIVAVPGVVDVDFTLYQGSAESSLDHSAILQIGYGSFNVEKAISTGKNAWMDGIYYIANTVSATTGFALSITGGTSPTPETTPDVAADDLAVGAAMVNNPKGTEFGFFAPTEWGAVDSATFFTGTDEQWYFIGDNQGGHTVGVGHFPFRLVGDDLNTNSWVLTRVVIVNTGTTASFDLSHADMDFVQMDACSIIDMGVITLAVANDVDKFFVDTVMVNCAQFVPNETNMDDCTFNGTSDASGAMLLDEVQDGTSALTGLTFNSDGTGYGIRMAPTGVGPFEYNFDNFQNNDYGADDTNDSFIRIAPADNDADITINLQNGAGTVTTDQRTPYAGTVTINNAVTLTVGGVTEGAAVKIIANETAGSITVGDVIFEILADVNGVAQLTTFNYEGAFGAGLDVIVRARQQGLPNFGISEDNAVFVDETTESNSSATNDMNLLVDTSPVAGQDWFYFGHAEQFGRIKLNIGTAMAGGALLDFEYWNGAWVNLSDVVDGTSDYTNTGENTISWTIPGDWATTSVDGNGPVHYVRIGYLSGTVSTAPRGRKVKLDVTRYLPFVQDNEITSTGLSTVASWAVDSIASF
jgi:hypothetical protein